MAGACVARQRQKNAAAQRAAAPASAIGEFFGHVGQAVKEMIVNDHKTIVFGHHQVLFQIIGFLSERKSLAFQGMLGQIAAGAPMSDHQFVRSSSVKRRCRKSDARRERAQSGKRNDTFEHCERNLLRMVSSYGTDSPVCCRRGPFSSFLSHASRVSSLEQN